MQTSVELVTPERVLYSGDADFVVLRSDGGEIMFLPNHAPYIGAVDICTMRIAREEGDEFRAAVHGGFVRVGGNTVTVLASVAEPADEIDVDRARRAFQVAEASVAFGQSQEAEHLPIEADHKAPVEESPVLQAMLYPEDPAVVLRRAQARLEAAGASEPGH